MNLKSLHRIKFIALSVTDLVILSFRGLWPLFFTIILHDNLLTCQHCVSKFQRIFLLKCVLGVCGFWLTMSPRKNWHKSTHIFHRLIIALCNLLFQLKWNQIERNWAIKNVIAFEDSLLFLDSSRHFYFKYKLSQGAFRWSLSCLQQKYPMHIIGIQHRNI